MTDAQQQWTLALDQGSHASKAVAFDTSGAVIATHSAEVATRQPREGWVEHDAEELIGSLQAAIAAVLATDGLHPAACAAAGLATQRSTIACWDREDGRALSPVLSWQDRRNAAWLAARDFDRAWLKRITGLVPSPHYGASKLRWCLDHLPAVRRARDAGRLAFGPLASFLLYRLLAERPLLVDPANAARTLLWDIHARDWSAELLAACCIPRACLPDCVPSRHAFGTLALGEAQVPLTVATGDQPAALFGGGEPEPRTLFVNLGTGAFVQRLFAGTPPEAPGLLQGVAWQDDRRSIGVLEGTVNGAGAAFAWLAGRHQTTMEVLEAEVPGWLEEAREPPLFVNGVGGLGSPYWIADCPVRFSRDADLPAEAVAVAESIVFLLAVNIAAIEAAAGGHGLPARRIVATGGLARLDGLCQRLTSLTGLPVERPAAFEATAHGLHWLMTGVLVEAPQRTRFDPQAADALASRYRRWQRIEPMASRPTAER